MVCAEAQSLAQFFPRSVLMANFSLPKLFSFCLARGSLGVRIPSTENVTPKHATRGELSDMPCFSC